MTAFLAQHDGEAADEEVPATDAPDSIVFDDLEAFLADQEVPSNEVFDELETAEI